MVSFLPARLAHGLLLLGEETKTKPPVLTVPRDILQAPEVPTRRNPAMKNAKQPASKSRRQFLRQASAAGGAAAVAASAPAAALAQDAEDGPSSQEPQGYRLTEHILAYYKSAAS